MIFFQRDICNDVCGIIDTEHFELMPVHDIPDVYKVNLYDTPAKEMYVYCPSMEHVNSLEYYNDLETLQKAESAKDYIAGEVSAPIIRLLEKRIHKRSC